MAKNTSIYKIVQVFTSEILIPEIEASSDSEAMEIFTQRVEKAPKKWEGVNLVDCWAFKL